MSLDKVNRLKQFATDHQNLQNICNHDISHLNRAIRRIHLMQEQVTYYDKAFKIGGEFLRTNRNDTRYSAKKSCISTSTFTHTGAFQVIFHACASSSTFFLA